MTYQPYKVSNWALEKFYAAETRDEAMTQTTYSAWHVALCCALAAAAMEIVGIVEAVLWI